ncbi:SulP family inorganic anion transporter [Terasakiella sp. A23]|uniref:SulP family inorganic anion transporter n=1 Tax=Terasakiella sp. FCG-A23 TaxID=3080561 RepID=UPI00295450AF|nr:SulP family inorganic anion transporter [Terasakiella sp. A23]MDV7338253.1 SulP family inorganic anion transporter [Terasakiella sp. A23]
MIATLRLDNLKGDIFGGLTAAVVALPLALAFGVASGVGPMAGLYGAILVGFFASLFGGTPAQVSGPTGPMTVVMTATVMQYADQPAVAFTVVMMSGLFQIAFGLARIGRFISFVPFSVISGFMSGIGVIIILLQLAPLLGHNVAAGGTVGAILYLPDLLSNIQIDAAVVGLLSLGIMIFCPQRISKIIPEPLIALVTCTVLSISLLPTAPIIGDIPSGLPDPYIPHILWERFPDMLGSAMMLALLGTIDSLLTSLIADNITKTEHNPNRELIGQGIGNALAGVMGAIPGAGATMRTVINVRAGGQTPIAGMIHALVLLAIVLGLGPLASHIPHAVLAGILLKVGWDIIDWPFLKIIKNAPKMSIFLTSSVLILTVFVDLVIAVGFGVVSASMITLHQMSQLQLQAIRTSKGSHGKSHLSQKENDLLADLGDHVFYCHFGGPVTFGAARGMAEILRPDDSCDLLILDMSKVTYIDLTTAYALLEIIENAKSNDLEVLMVAMCETVAQVLETLGILNEINEHHIHLTRTESFKNAKAYLENKYPHPDQG